ncbi:hypothetical protein NGUA28_02881 [Salmonella enterica]|nr:hypothetical protein NGUA28_02881 [Salmonella enterica]
MPLQRFGHGIKDQIAIFILWIGAHELLLVIHQIHRARMRAQKISIVPLFLHNNVNHSQRQRDIRTGDNRHPLVRFGCGFIKSGVDNHQPRPITLRLRIMFKIGVHGHCRAISPAQDITTFGYCVAGIGIA